MHRLLAHTARVPLASKRLQRLPRALRATMGILAALGLSLVAFGFAGDAHAAGLVYPDVGTRALGRAGAFVARGDDISAIAINPAQLAKLRGWEIDLMLNIAHHPITFDCTGLPNCYNADGSRATSVSNIGGLNLANMGPVVGVSTNFGLKKWTFAFAFMGPPGVGNKAYDPHGPQRYDLIDINFVVGQPMLAAAFAPIPQLRIGATFIWSFATIDTSVAAKFIASRNPITYVTGDQVTNLKGKSIFSPGGDVGLAWDAAKWLELAASVRLPLYLTLTGDATVNSVAAATDPSGKTTYTSTPQKLTDPTFTFKTNVPPIAKFGIRYKNLAPAVGEDDKPVERFDIELDVFYEPWQLHQSIDVDFKGKLELLNQGIPPVKRVEGYQGSVGIRLGSDINVIPNRLTFRLGGFYETGAIPRELTNVSFISNKTIGVAAGLSVRIRGWEFFAAYEHIFVPDIYVPPGLAAFRRNEVQPGMPALAAADLRAVNAGLYQASYNVFGVGARWFIDETFKKAPAAAGAFLPTLASK